MKQTWHRVALSAAFLTFVACDNEGPVQVTTAPAPRAVVITADLEGGTDHFTCYEAIEDDAGTSATVTLDDQWQTLTNVGVSNILEFCNPTEKTVDESTTTIEEPEAHLAFYELTQKLPSIKKRVTIDNQFGQQVLRVAAPKLLAVPTVKNEVGDLGDVEGELSHFTCYEASGKRVLAPANIADQFQTKDILVHVPQYFCLPAEKTRGTTVTEIARDEDHLVCYKVTPSESPPGPPTPSIENQFETDNLKIGPLHFLCVPSEKVSFTTSSE
jgi:hypothetical protein